MRVGLEARPTKMGQGGESRPGDRSYMKGWCAGDLYRISIVFLVQSVDHSLSSRLIWLHGYGSRDWIDRDVKRNFYRKRTGAETAPLREASVRSVDPIRRLVSLNRDREKISIACGSGWGSDLP